jgi:hypothetical protein
VLDPAYRDFYAREVGRPSGGSSSASSHRVISQRPGVMSGFHLCRGNQQSRWPALSPQCGFATSILGNALSTVDQQAKLQTIIATTKCIW